MPELKEGSRGPQVAALQTRLKELGFDPKGVDGKFGSNTGTALMAFQISKGLTPDGVADDEVLLALGLTADEDDSGPAPATNVTAAIVAKMFPGTPVANIKENLPIVLEALAAVNLDDKNMILMALGTIRAETASFLPISEGISHFNTSPSGHPFDKYDNRGDLGNVGPPDGNSYKGRGFVQLTGRANYQEHGIAIGLGNQLVENPSLANQPDIAAKLLASFLKRKEQAIRSALSHGDLKTARKLVNGGSHGLDNFTSAFNIGKQLISDG